MMPQTMEESSMKKCLIFGLIVSFVLSAGNILLAHERTWPAKRLKRIYPEATKFTSKQVTLTTAQIVRIQKHKGIKIGVEDKSPTFYFAKQKSKVKKGKLELIGVIIFIDEYGANGKMEISVGMTPEGKIDRIDPWQHKEDKRITKKNFLEQFKEKDVDFDFHPGETVKLVKGAEKASLSVMRAAQKSLLIMDEVFRKKEREHARKVGKKKAHHGEEKKIEKPKTLKDVFQSIAHERHEIGEAIESGNLDNVHKFAFAIADLADFIPGLDQKADSSKKKRVKDYLDRIRKRANLLDRYGDEGNAKKTKSELAKLDKELALLNKQYPKESAVAQHEEKEEQHEKHEEDEEQED